MDFSTICRTCLGTKCLNPIFKDKEDSRYSTAVFLTTGLKVTINDGLPQQMCKKCVKLINATLKFRKQSRNAETQLLQIKNSRLHCENDFKDLKVRTEPILNRKKSKDLNNDCINFKIEGTSVNDDEIPLKNLFKNTLYTDQKFKIETQYTKTEVENEIQDTNSNNFIRDLIQSKVTEESIGLNNSTDDLNYNEEFLDETFESNSETETDKIVINIDVNDLSEIANMNPVENSLSDVTNIESMPFIIQDSKRVTCKLCQKDLSRRSIDSHMTKRHPGADTRKVKCDLCDTYVLKTRLNRHKIIMHGRDCFRCGYCKTEFDNRDVLIDHVQSCTAKTKKRKTTETTKRKGQMVECDICHKMMQKASLRIHKEVKHAGMGPVCEHCGRRFGNKFRLNEHLRAKHGYEKFKCSICEFTSATSMAMRNHERRHRGEKPFVCDACGAKFHAPHLLSQHKQSHRTEKLMKCDLCPAAFKANNTLHMHKITCHNAHTYQCNMCPRTYSCRHYAVKHLRNVHRHFGPVGDLRKSVRAAAGGGTSDVNMQQVEDILVSQ